MKQHSRLPEYLEQAIKEMYSDGLTIGNIARYWEIYESRVKWIVSKKYRTIQTSRIYDWARKNPKRKKEIDSKAGRKHYLAHRGEKSYE
jgi:hypothetical protein